MKTSKPEAQPGDRVSIKTKNKEEKGTLLKSHNPKIILLKLDSGYNIGIKKQNIQKIKVIEKAKKTKQPPEIKHIGKNRIDIIMTGGTISSRLDSKTGGVKSLTKPKDLINLFPKLAKIIDIRKIKVPFMKFSENMQGKDWKKLARTVQESLNDKNCQGVIITHGTDFLHYTASALSFMLQNLNKPVVLTYSQRSSDRGSSDAKLNLECSAYAALSDIAEVILVGHSSINDNYCNILQGTKVRKMHTSRRDTFKPINCQPIGEVYPDGKINIKRKYNKRNNQKVKINAKFSDKVALIKFYPGQNPNLINYYVEKKYKGIIIEVSGLGHVSQNLIPSIKKAVKKGVVICAAAQTIFGRLDPYVYSTGRKLIDVGVIFLQDMLPETAYVKLAWLLGHKQKGIEVVKKQMLENKAKELNPQLGIEFL
jgi:glutamyl-tRNA(Gln) amidotransferase subunit D